MVFTGGMWSQMGSIFGTLMFLGAIFQQYIPGSQQLRDLITRYGNRAVALVYPYIQIKFHEYPGDGFNRSTAYAAIETYLGANTSTRAKRLKGDVVKDGRSLVLSMDDQEEIAEEFEGVRVWWVASKNIPHGQTISFYPRGEEVLSDVTFHRCHRQRKLYTNSKGDTWGGSWKRMWSPVVFEHPATFDTLAMDPIKKKEITNDLLAFIKAKAYYEKIGKAWKRGYLLYGPPGTGKSSMIAAMANFLEYDVYDLELTAVKDNTELRKLLINTSGKSVLVIEDIDCSLDLTGQRKKKKGKKDEKEEGDGLLKNEDEDSSSKVTLSGLLNFIDGLWSACGGERIIVFTTNHVDKLDPALIRRGRMDKHVELSYCCFEGFKLLARNYLDVGAHHLFDKIRVLLEEVEMTPADVAENLMPKSAEDDADACLGNLIRALEMAKEENKLEDVGEEGGEETKCGELREKEASTDRVEENGTS
ncbi:LOW QUALITY PROTEIN: hypothetical protein RJ639_024024 [Escallonia herrerae]|uniref:AAA+ ATPase domain-containing protein n=1 Tax=Escallonia herrerae TaxID=1293975 RepID=A0AA89ADR1_9ASTE|nr:LOW QUALITY PROTEIN: hypothetical protein RJ639_024024 [Escallonia herrerae]